MFPNLVVPILLISCIGAWASIFVIKTKSLSRKWKIVPLTFAIGGLVAAFWCSPETYGLFYGIQERQAECLRDRSLLKDAGNDVSGIKCDQEV